MRKLILSALTAVAALAIAPNALAADYYVVGGTQRALIVVEASSLQKDGDAVIGGVLMIFRKGGQVQAETGSAHAREIREYRCATRKARSLSTVLFNADQKQTKTIQSPSAWDDVPPGSMDDETFKAFCQRDLRKESTLLRGIPENKMVAFGSAYLEEKLTGVRQNLQGTLK